MGFRVGGWGFGVGVKGLGVWGFLSTCLGLRKPARARAATSELIVAENRPVRLSFGSFSRITLIECWKPMSKSLSAC